MRSLALLYKQSKNPINESDHEQATFTLHGGWRLVATSTCSASFGGVMRGSSVTGKKKAFKVDQLMTRKPRREHGVVIHPPCPHRSYPPYTSNRSSSNLPDQRSFAVRLFQISRYQAPIIPSRQSRSLVHLVHQTSLCRQRIMGTGGLLAETLDSVCASGCSYTIIKLSASGGMFSHCNIRIPVRRAVTGVFVSTIMDHVRPSVAENLYPRSCESLPSRCEPC